MQKRDTIKSMIKRTRMRNLIKGVDGREDETTGKKGRRMRGEERRQRNNDGQSDKRKYN